MVDEVKGKWETAGAPKFSLSRLFCRLAVGLGSPPPYLGMSFSF